MRGFPEREGDNAMPNKPFRGAMKRDVAVKRLGASICVVGLMVAVIVVARAQQPQPAQQSQPRPPASDAGNINAEVAAKILRGRGFSPYAGRGYATRVWWGEQHLHTGW